MGLDNGVIVRRYHNQEVPILKRLGFKWVDWKNELVGYDVCYWRRSYEIRKIFLREAGVEIASGTYIIPFEAMRVICVDVRKYIFSKQAQYSFAGRLYHIKQWLKLLMIKYIARNNDRIEILFYDSY